MEEGEGRERKEEAEEAERERKRVRRRLEVGPQRSCVDEWCSSVASLSSQPEQNRCACLGQEICFNLSCHVGEWTYIKRWGYV